jgi:hypothetical protein
MHKLLFWGEDAAIGKLVSPRPMLQVVNSFLDQSCARKLGEVLGADRLPPRE